MNIRERLSRLFDATDESWKSAEPVQMGVVKVGANLVLCHPSAKVRGVKLVTVSEDFVNDYNTVCIEYEKMQKRLAELPTSLRPRVRRAAKEITHRESSNGN